jgi:hypothetical protein
VGVTQALDGRRGDLLRAARRDPLLLSLNELLPAVLRLTDLSTHRIVGWLVECDLQRATVTEYHAYLLGQKRRGALLVVRLVVLLDVNLDRQSVQDAGHILDVIELNVNDGANDLRNTADDLLLGRLAPCRASGQEGFSLRKASSHASQLWWLWALGNCAGELQEALIATIRSAGRIKGIARLPRRHTRCLTREHMSSISSFQSIPGEENKARALTNRVASTLAEAKETTRRQHPPRLQEIAKCAACE